MWAWDSCDLTKAKVKFPTPRKALHVKFPTLQGQSMVKHLGFVQVVVVENLNWSVHKDTNYRPTLKTLVRNYDELILWFLKRPLTLSGKSRV